jgi:hypothetical protein
MKKLSPVAVLFVLWAMTACNKSAPPANRPAPAVSQAASSSPGADAVQQKLQEYSGAGATNCGRFDVHAAEAQLKSASDCSMQASQGKKPFFVSYDMPGMSVGVAGNAEGKLFTVQNQGMSGFSSGVCPAALRVAASGRVTCFAPGDMGSMSGSHAGGAMPPGMPNPHASGGKTSSNQ